MNEISIALNIPTIIFFSITLLAIGVCLFLIGYFLGKQTGYGVYNVATNKPNSFFNNNSTTEKISKVTIDNTKFVTEIRTEGMEKKYDKLGEVKESSENITNSINKLKNLKR